MATIISRRSLVRTLQLASVSAILGWSATAIFLAERACRLPPQSLIPQLAPTAISSIETPAGITLRAWTQEPVSWNGKAIILLHGVGDSHCGTSGIAAMFVRNGYRSISPDNRGHGASGGKTFSHGVRERNDVCEEALARRWGQIRVPQRA